VPLTEGNGQGAPRGRAFLARRGGAVDGCRLSVVHADLTWHRTHELGDLAMYGLTTRWSLEGTGTQVSDSLRA
jgi:hypothetical protein